MRWQSLSGRAETPVWLWPLVPLVVVVLTPFFALYWAVRAKRMLMGPREQWSVWFAWHPVQLGGPFGDWVWLQWVQRRARDAFEGVFYREYSADGSAE